MATREVGPGKTYATIALAAAAASDGDTIECFFDTTDTSFLYQPPAVTIKAATGFSPKWLSSSGTPLTTCIRAMIVDGLEIGTTGSKGTFFNAASYSAAGFGVILRNCSFSFGTGTPAVMDANVQAVGNVPMSLTIENCTMAQTTNRLGALLGVSGASVTQLCKGTLRVIDSTLRTAGLRELRGNGLFVEQHVERSIIQIATVDGSFVDFDTGSTSTLYQSVLDGLGTATALMTADCAKTTVDVKSSYLMRAVGNAVTLTNCAASDLFVNTAFIDNKTALDAANTVTNNCLFDGNTDDYVGGGAFSATDITGTVTYEDLAGGDYAPTDLSDTIDAGIDVGFVTDLVGEAIPQGAGPDIGPYEWVPLVPPVTPVVCDSGATANATVIATYLDGTPLAGFAAYDLFPAHGDRLVTLAQIVLISLFSDRVAASDDELPPGQDDRRGWFADTTGDKIGSRLWLMESSAVTDTTLDDCRFYAAEALAHMTRDGLATSVEIKMDIVTDDANPIEARLETTITVRLDEKRGVILKFPDLWGL